MALHSNHPAPPLHPAAHRQFSYSAWLWRGVGAAIAILLGSIIAPIMSTGLLIFVTGAWDFGPLWALSTAALTSSFVSTMQTLLFKDVIPRRGIWFMSNALILFIGLCILLTYNTNMPFAGLLIGVASGLVQWVQLRKSLHKAFTWVILNAVIWSSLLFGVSTWIHWLLTE